MSFAHVRLTKVSEDNWTVEYLVESFDFNPQGEWQEVGRLRIDKEASRYTFDAGGPWQGAKVLPPAIFGLAEMQRRALIEAEYGEYGWGARSMRIHHWATMFLKERRFPQNHPEAFFPGPSARKDA
ncbi:MAG: hypothetical protein K6U08_09065 [Firmicutes bacterium]|nr:hypothetical protein [Bacillota bacterium]